MSSYERSKADTIAGLGTSSSNKNPKLLTTCVPNQFDEDYRPITGTNGQRLTPSELFRPGDAITVTIGKSHPHQEVGLKVEQRRNGKYYVRKVPRGGLFARTPVLAMDKIVELNGIDAQDFTSVNELKQILRDEPQITIVVIRKDPDAAYQSSDDDNDDEDKDENIDYSTLSPIGPDGTTLPRVDYYDSDGGSSQDR